MKIEILLLDPLFPLNAGVIIIGSLWWEGDEKQDSKGRLKWRNEHLGQNLKEKAIPVKLPIRYGRYSYDQTYTMVFSSGIEQSDFGVGIVVPVKNNPLSSLDDLKKEVEAMSNAEQMKKGFISGGPTNGAWATMAFVINSNFINPDKIREWWSQQLEKSENPGKKQIDNPKKKYKIGDERESILTDYGAMNINWSQAVDASCQSEIDNLDILFAACTKPKHESGENRYPTPEEIACAENTKPPGSRDYFRNNRAHGIITFQDGDIMKNLNKQ